MKKLFKEVNYSLSSLIDHIDLGILGLPDIQRPFVWKDTKVRDLFDSMYKGYPVGYFLFWANSNIENTKGIGTGHKQKHPSLLIVDGQQRLTSLYAVIKGVEVIRKNYEKTEIVIAFNPLEEKFVIPDASIQRNPRYIQNITDLWRKDADIFDLVESFVEKLRLSVDLTAEDVKKIRRSLNNLTQLPNYPFSALELSAEIDEEQVADVFVRINSEGKKLNQADFILTLMSVFWENGRKDLEEFAKNCKLPTKSEASPFNYLIEPSPEQLLRVSVGFAFRRARLQYVYSILRGKDLETGQFSAERRTTQFERLAECQSQVLGLTNWHEFIKAIKQAGFVKSEYISSKNNLLYAYVFFLIGKIDLKMDLYELKRLIAKWFFMISITGRYTGSPETDMEADLAKLRSVNTPEAFTQVLFEIIDSHLTSDFWSITLVTDLATSSSRSPSLFAYYAAQYILNAKGLFSKLSVIELLQDGLKSKKSALEKHHLFPKAWLKKNGYDDQTLQNQIANYALVEWSDNIEISDKHPSDYLPHYTNRFNEHELEEMYFLHALPRNWEQMEYPHFLIKRRKMISKVIREAYLKL